MRGHLYALAAMAALTAATMTPGLLAALRREALRCTLISRYEDVFGLEVADLPPRMFRHVSAEVVRAALVAARRVIAGGDDAP